MSTKVLTFSILSFISAVFADDFKTLNGKEYKDATVTRVEPDGIVLKTKSGIMKVYFMELPKDVQQRFNYNPQGAAGDPPPCDPSPCGGIIPSTCDYGTRPHPTFTVNMCAPDGYSLKTDVYLKDGADYTLIPGIAD